MKKTLVSAITTALVVGAASTTFAAANPFSDVPADSWAYDAVTKLAQDGVINGYGDGTFRGDNTITRYEMAQIVAKAMAKSDVSAADKATIDKLAAEFADELNNLGVRVDNLEKRMDNVKWGGLARYEYTSTKKDNHDRANTDHMVFRLEPSVQINDNWTAHTRIQYTGDLTTNDDNTDSEAKMNRAWVEGDIGAVHTKFGKLPTFSAQGVIMDDTVSGAELSFGKVVKTTLTAGRYSPSFDLDGDPLTDPTEVKGDYAAVQFDYAATDALSLTAGYYQFKDEDLTAAIDKDTNKIWAVGGTYKFNNTVALDGYYAHSNIDSDESANRKAYNAELRYKGAEATAPGSFGVWAAYRHIGELATVAPTWDAVKANEKGYEIGADYALDKNIIATARYFSGSEVDNDNIDVTRTYAKVDFLF